MPRRIIALYGLLFVFLAAVILTWISQPGDFFYHLKKTWYNVQTDLAPTLQDKAAIRLLVVEDLLKQFKSVQAKNPHDRKLLDIAKELVGQEQAGIYYLDKAKKDNQNIKANIKVLCDSLEAQQVAIADAYYASSTELQPELHDVLSKTDVYLSQALNW